jgi:hypothetical protein
MRNGNDWTSRFPWIVDAALKNRRKQFVIDGEAVILGVGGVPAPASTAQECRHRLTRPRHGLRDLEARHGQVQHRPARGRGVSLAPRPPWPRRSHDLSLYRFAGSVRHRTFGSKKVSCFQPISRSASGVSHATPALLSQ